MSLGSCVVCFDLTHNKRVALHAGGSTPGRLTLRQRQGFGTRSLQAVSAPHSSSFFFFFFVLFSRIVLRSLNGGIAQAVGLFEKYVRIVNGPMKGAGWSTDKADEILGEVRKQPE